MSQEIHGRVVSLANEVFGVEDIDVVVYWIFTPEIIVIVYAILDVTNRILATIFDPDIFPVNFDPVLLNAVFLGNVPVITLQVLH